MRRQHKATHEVVRPTDDYNYVTAQHSMASCCCSLVNQMGRKKTVHGILNITYSCAHKNSMLEKIVLFDTKN